MARFRCLHVLLIELTVIGLPALQSVADESDHALTTFVASHCFSCHSGEGPKAGFDLQQIGGLIRDAESIRRWTDIYDRVASGEMPPASEPRLQSDSVQSFLKALHAELVRADARQRVTVLRRLNRVEYENTVRDLFGIRVDVREVLPEDASANGFDTNGAALSISPEQMESYLQAADLVIDEVFGPELEPTHTSVKMPLSDDEFVGRQIGKLFLRVDNDSLVVFQDHWCPLIFVAGKVKSRGTYRVQIRAKTYHSNSPLVMSVTGGDVISYRRPSHVVGYFDVTSADEWQTITFDDYLEKDGCYHLKPFDLRSPMQGPKRFAGPGLMIGEVSIEGPLEDWPSTSRTALLQDTKVASATLNDARAILIRLLSRAFRCEIVASDAEPFVDLVKSALDSKQSFRDALRVGMKAILCSPRFLFREESAQFLADGEQTTISDEALASRISYFLWSSMPDDELSSLAAAKKLNDTDILHAQVDRMLRDSKSDRFVENFTGQWLGLRNLRSTQPDAKLYPEFDEILEYAILQETHRFFREILNHDLSLLEFIDSNWSILNERLARHYGIKGIEGQSFRKVELPADGVRGGVLTQASVLKVTANGTTTSPVVRGAWVLDSILGKPSPPVPSNIPAIEPDIRGAATVREQLDKHRNVESCAVCHRRIDPPGFALESFDPIGGWRRSYRTLGVGLPIKTEVRGRKVEYKSGRAVQSDGNVESGKSFSDIRDFKKLLLEDKPQLARGLTQKLLTYSLGRELGFRDREAVDVIVARVERSGYGFRTLIHEIIQSPTFRQK